MTQEVEASTYSPTDHGLLTFFHDLDLDDEAFESSTTQVPVEQRVQERHYNKGYIPKEGRDGHFLPSQPFTQDNIQAVYNTKTGLNDLKHSISHYYLHRQYETAFELTCIVVDVLYDDVRSKKKKKKKKNGETAGGDKELVEMGGRAAMKLMSLYRNDRQEGKVQEVFERVEGWIQKTAFTKEPSLRLFFAQFYSFSPRYLLTSLYHYAAFLSQRIDSKSYTELSSLFFSVSSLPSLAPDSKWKLLWMKFALVCSQRALSILKNTRCKKVDPISKQIWKKNFDQNLENTNKVIEEINSLAKKVLGTRMKVDVIFEIRNSEFDSSGLSPNESEQEKENMQAEKCEFFDEILPSYRMSKSALLSTFPVSNPHFLTSTASNECDLTLLEPPISTVTFSLKSSALQINNSEVTPSMLYWMFCENVNGISEDIDMEVADLGKMLWESSDSNRNGNGNGKIEPDAEDDDAGVKCL